MERDDPGAAQEFIAGAMRLRSSAQRQYAEKALQRLYEIAMKDDGGSAQVSALRELLDQVLGRPMAPVGTPAQQNEDAIAAIAAFGAGLREKLARIAHSGAAEKPDGPSD